MRVLTYNIWDGGNNVEGGDRRERILEVVRDAKPDILAIQEACGFSSREAEDWGRELGMDGVLGEAPSGYHVLLYVRPPLRVQEHELIHPRAFLHACLSAVVSSSFGEIRLLAVHLDPFDPEARLSEARYLARLADADRNVLLMGDFNAFSPSDTIDESVYDESPRFLARHVRADGLGIGNRPEIDIRAIELLQWAGYRDVFRGLNPDAPGRTTPTKAGKPRAHMRLDYILATPAMMERAQSCEVLRTPASDTGSDHYPVLAELGD